MKTIVNFNEGTRKIEVFLSGTYPVEKELPELVSLACKYIADFEYNAKKFLFTAKCTNTEDTEMLLNDYNQYFFTK